MPRSRYRIISVIALLATLLALLAPGEHLALLAWWWPWGIEAGVGSHSQGDKLIHAFMFAVCGCFMVLGWLTRVLQMLPIFLVMFTIGAGIEWLQGGIPGRSADVWDAVADAIGTAAGMALGLHLLRRDLSS